MNSSDEGGSSHTTKTLWRQDLNLICDSHMPWEIQSSPLLCYSGGWEDFQSSNTFLPPQAAATASAAQKPDRGELGFSNPTWRSCVSPVWFLLPSFTLCPHTVLSLGWGEQHFNLTIHFWILQVIFLGCITIKWLSLLKPLC